MLEIQVLACDRHKNVEGLNRLMGSQPSPLLSVEDISYYWDPNPPLSSQWKILVINGIPTLPSPLSERY